MIYWFFDTQKLTKGQQGFGRANSMSELAEPLVKTWKYICPTIYYASLSKIPSLLDLRKSLLPLLLTRNLWATRTSGVHLKKRPIVKKQKTGPCNNLRALIGYIALRFALLEWLWWVIRWSKLFERIYYIFVEDFRSHNFSINNELCLSSFQNMIVPVSVSRS